VALALAVPPAEASILPRVDFKRGDLDLAVGIYDLAVDAAVLDRLSVGAALIPAILPVPVLGLPTLAAGRATWRFSEPGDLAWGVTASAMFFRNPTSGSGNFFLQPALNWAWRPGGGDGGFTLRATLSLMDVLTLPAPIPNLELAFRVGKRHELTLLGGGLIGFRGHF